jgi:hypothetical protein
MTLDKKSHPRGALPNAGAATEELIRQTRERKRIRIARIFNHYCATSDEGTARLRGVNMKLLEQTKVLTISLKINADRFLPQLLR